MVSSDVNVDLVYAHAHGHTQVEVEMAMTPDAPPPTCLVCHRRTPAIGYTCAACRIRTRNQLAALPDLAALAWQAITPAGHGEHGSGKPGSRPPIDVAALDDSLGLDALAVLEAWERAFRDDFGLVAYGLATEDTPVTLARAVTWHLTWLDRILDSHPACDVYAGEVAHEYRALRRHDPERPARHIRVPCPVDGCGRPLPVDPTDLRAPVVCRCGEQWTADRLMLVAFSDPATTAWLDPEAAAYATGVSERTLRRWAAAGWVRRAHGRYDLASIRAAVTSAIGVS